MTWCVFLFADVMKEQMEQVLGQVEVELDGRFASVRNRETNLGKLLKVM